MQDNIEKEGFEYKFDPSKCAQCEGKCCTGESGYIWLTPAEMEAIAKYINVDMQTFKEKYLRKIRYRYSLKEIQREDDFACIFFDQKAKNCSIYDVRPKQCATFPFWDYFKNHIDEAVDECPGIIL